eukprot:6190643-Pleurochrysis_carterae.AAC.1
MPSSQSSAQAKGCLMSLQNTQSETIYRYYYLLFLSQQSRSGKRSTSKMLAVTPQQSTEHTTKRMQYK